MLVYQARNILTNKVYVGKTTRTLAHAKSRHKNRATKAWKNGCESKFYNSIRKHGWDNFEWHILYTGISDTDIQEKEKQYIAKYDTLNNGYNSTPGGDGGAGKKLSHTHKRKLAKAIEGEKNRCYGKYGAEHPAYGNVHTDAAKDAIRKAHKDKPKTDEHKQKLSIAKKRISRFTQDDYDNIVKMRLEGSTYKEIGSAFNAHPSVVRKIFKRETTSNMR